jgi:hypothetical protein
MTVISTTQEIEKRGLKFEASLGKVSKTLPQKQVGHGVSHL